MQRKNSILRHNHKNGMALIMAIAVIVIIATIMALSMSLTTQTTKRTNDLYLYEESTLLAKSAAEYALLRIAQDNNATNPCNFTSANFTQDSIYDINLTVRYVYTNFPATCAASAQYTTVTTPEQNGSVLIDVAVSVTDPTVTTEPIRYFRRTLQKL